MALTGEWRTRIENWSKELRAHFVLPLMDLELSGFTTRDALPAAAAAARRFKAMPPGTPWGGKWEYGWFRAQVSIPLNAKGHRIVLSLNPGGEGLVFIDGRPAGARDKSHAWLTLTHQARGGESFEVLIEAYAGHGPTPRSVGPLPPGREAISEPPPAQQTVGATTLGIWQEEIYQLWLDVQTLFELREQLDRDSLRVAEIDAGLRDFSTLIDFELTPEKFMTTARAARARLRPLLQCVNGSTAPIFFAFGHGHLDVAWLWPLAETERKAARTLSNQLALAREYPGYRFMHSQAHLFWMVKRKYPEFYRRVRRAVQKGRIVAEGGMWVEADTNLAGGESLIRQFLHGKRFFKEEFGVDSRMLWLPDVFGYSAAPDAAINAPSAVARAAGRTLENELIRVVFNDRGEIVSLYDKESRRETLQGAGNVFKMYKDTPTRFDAWDIDSSYLAMPVALDEPARIAVSATGPLLASLTIARKLHNSTVTQIVSLRRGSRRLDFETSVDWRESHKLLKVAFPAALHEIQFGHVARPTHRSRPYDADRFEVCNHKWTAMVEEGRGFAILNDCKYGVDVRTNVINLTLLRASKAPDAHADLGVQSFTYAAYAWNGALVESRLVQEAYELNSPVTSHAGAAGEGSLFSLNAPNIIVEAVKPAEDAPQDVIVRLYESMRTATRCTLTTALPFSAVQATDLLEQPAGRIKTRGREIDLDFRPFEIKTLRFALPKKSNHSRQPGRP